jgi:hypothetical protein
MLCVNRVVSYLLSYILIIIGGVGLTESLGICSSP